MADAPSPELPGLIRALLRPDAYPHTAGSIELIQTHISYVLLAGAYAYKIKKPVDLGFVDYRSLSRRKTMCDEEVRLNRRLCADVYMDVVPIVAEADGYRIGGAGEPIEYAVQMRRVPEDRMMPALLRAGVIARDDVRRLAILLSEFHAAAPHDARVAAYGRNDAVRSIWDENFEQTRAYVGRTITQLRFDALRAYAAGFTEAHRWLIEERADADRVRDGHGDLRSDSVVFADDGSACIMDCIEFSERLRCGDVASDVAFLAMDLEYRGRRDLADEFIGAYIESSCDGTLGLVLPFYACYRAYVRGKVESMLSDDQQVGAEARREAARRADAYFALAERYTTRSAGRTLVMMVGLSGTGKSYIANALAGHIGAALISTDLVRRELPTDEQGGSAAYDAGRYTDAARERVYEAMRGRAEGLLRRGYSVILDATHARRSDRALARQLAADTNAAFLAVDVRATDDAVRAHFDRRREAGRSTSDAGWATYVEQKRRAEPLDEIPAAFVVQIDGADGLEGNLDAIAARLVVPP
jgi:aminoglycoside phosphotransferase family enzyme/predicted kinase